jgi:hypothetical protein
MAAHHQMTPPTALRTDLANNEQVFIGSDLIYEEELIAVEEHAAERRQPVLAGESGEAAQFRSIGVAQPKQVHGAGDLRFE